MWQGLQTITDYNGKHSRELHSDTSLPDELNYFYARFKANNTETCMRAPAVPEDCVNQAFMVELLERQTIKQAERQNRTKIESYYTGSDAHRMWQGLQTITDYKGKHSRELHSDTSLPDELHYFYARFEANNTETCMRAPAVP